MRNDWVALQGMCWKFLKWVGKVITHFLPTKKTILLFGYVCVLARLLRIEFREKARRLSFSIAFLSFPRYSNRQPRIVDFFSLFKFWRSIN